MRLMDTSDRALIQRWQRNADGEAFSELVRRHAGMVFAAAERVLRNRSDAEEIVQETFLKAGQARRLRGDSAGGLLHTIATHLAINRLRSESRRREREIAYATVAAPHAEYDWSAMAPHVDEAIASLPDGQREAIVLHFLEGRTYRAIARAKGVDESTVRHHAQRGLARIRRFLQRRGIAVASATLAAELAGHVEAATLSTPLLTALGKQAIAGPPVLSGMSTAATIGLGGTAIMMKKIALGFGVAAAIAASVATWRVVKRDEMPVPAPIDNESESQATVASSSQQFADQVGVDSIVARQNESKSSDTQTAGGTVQDIPFDKAEEVLDALFAKALGFGDAIGPAGSGGVGSDWDSTFHSEDLPEDNGMHYFLKASELLAGQQDMNEDDWEDIYRRLAAGESLSDDELVRFNEMQDAFDLIRIGLEVGNISMPFGNEGPETLMPFLSVWRYTARIMNLDAEMQMLQGNYAAGLDDYQTLVAFGNELGRGGPLINGLVGVAVGNIGVDSLTTVLAQGDMTVDEYRTVIASLQDIQANKLTHWETLLNEQGYTVEWFEDMGSTPNALREFLSSQEDDSSSAEMMYTALQAMPDEDLIRYFNQYREDYERIVQYSTLPYYEAIAYLEDDGAFTPNVVSNMVLPAVSSTLTAYALRDARLQGAITIAAVEAYRVENGAYPKSLETLVPAYLAARPIDPFTGVELRFKPRPNGYRLYSSGPDMTDNGGLVSDFKKPGTDVVFHR